MKGQVATKRDDGLTDRQKRFIDALSSGETIEGASSAAGYSNLGIMAAATRSPQVQAEMRAIRIAEVRGTLAAKALKALGTLIECPATPAATRLSAAKWILEQAGHTTALASDDGDKPMHEMTEKELISFMKRTQKAIDAGESAPVITVAPGSGAQRSL